MVPFQKHTQQMGSEEDSSDASLCVVRPVTAQRSHRVKEKKRRQHLNHLYENLRGLLPCTKKKLSIPAAICTMVRYIPALQRELESLVRHREDLVAVKKVREQAESMARLGSTHSKRVQFLEAGCCPNVSVSPLGRAKFKVIIQTEYRLRLCFSELVIMFEEEGMEVSQASSFLSPHKAWYSLQLQSFQGCSLDASILRLKILLLCQDRDPQFYGTDCNFL